MLDGDDTEKGLSTVEEGRAALRVLEGSPETIRKIRALGIAEVPADGRMPLELAKLLARDSLKYAKSVIEGFMNLKTSGGLFVVADLRFSGQVVLLRAKIVRK